MHPNSGDASLELFGVNFSPRLQPDQGKLERDLGVDTRAHVSKPHV